MGRDIQSSSWDSTSRCSGPNCSPQSTIRYVRCSWGNIQWRWPRIIISIYCRLSNQMGSPSSHILCVFPPVKRSCRSGGQTGKAHANGQCWPHWVSEQRWPPACITPGAQHAGARLQYIYSTSTGGIWQAHSRYFFLHQPMHQVQQPIDTSHMAWGMVPKGGRHANQDASFYRSPRHACAITCTYIARRQSIPAKPTWFTP